MVLVMVDQLATSWLEAAESGVVDLPNLRALRSSGLEFTNAFTNNPVCSPARATIATGLYSQGHGVTECGYDLDPAVPTFMQVLQSAGWRTGAFGKLHFQTQVDNLFPDYRPYGFDVTRITEDSRAGEWTDWVAQTHPEHYRAALATVWMTMVPQLQRYGTDGRNLLEEILDAQRQYPETAGEAYALPFPEEVSQSHWITSQACDFIATVPKDEPFFAQVSYVQPHNPFTPPREYLPSVNVEAIPEPIAAEWTASPRLGYFQKQRYSAPSYSHRDWRNDRRHYFADLAHLDHEIGRLRRCLKEQGRDEETVIIFTSDHGELLHDHGLVGKWERHYDACIRVPLVIAGPGIVPASRDELVDHADIAPTIYDLTGLKHPSLPRPQLARHHGTGDPTARPLVPEVIDPLPGRSLLALNGTATTPEDWRASVFIQSDNNPFEASPTAWARTVRTRRYRYSLFLDDGGEQLFDLRQDPSEQTNRAYDPAYRQERENLRATMLEALVLERYPNGPRGLAGIGKW